VPVHRRVALPHWPCIRFLFVGPPICLRLPPHPASLRRSCPLFKPGAGFWLSVPLLAARRGLAPPSSMPCVAHDGSRPSPGRRPKICVNSDSFTASQHEVCLIGSRNVLILRKLRSSCLEGRAAPLR